MILSSLQFSHGQFYPDDTNHICFFSKAASFHFKDQNTVTATTAEQARGMEPGGAYYAAEDSQSGILPRCTWQQRAQVTLLALRGGRDFIHDKHPEHSQPSWAERPETQMSVTVAQSKDPPSRNPMASTTF